MDMNLSLGHCVPIPNMETMQAGPRERLFSKADELGISSSATPSHPSPGCQGDLMATIKGSRY